MAFLRRNIRSAPQSAKDKAYKTYVHPTLEYASTTWASKTATLNQKIEMVQRRSARFVMNGYRRTSSATAMLETLNWDTLERRRDQARLTMMYRIVHQLVDIPAETYLTPSSQTGRTRGHDTRFQQIQTCFAGYQNSFIPCTIVLWNQLPQSAVSQTTLDAFQSHLATLSSWIPQHFYLLDVFNLLYIPLFIRGAWATPTTLREYSSIEGGN